MTTRPIAISMLAGAMLWGGAALARPLGASLSPFKRAQLATRVVRQLNPQRTLSLRQKVGIYRAHFVGALQRGADGKRPARLGNYSMRQLVKKYRILRRAGFSRSETRALMKSGVAGLKDKLVEAFAVWNAGDACGGGRLVNAYEFAERHGLNKKRGALFGEKILGYYGDPESSQRARDLPYSGREHMKLVTEDYYH